METPENTQENKRQLTPAMENAKWKPGQSGNPGGRPKKKPVTDYLIDQLDQPIPESMKSQLPEVCSLRCMAEKLPSVS
jgi:hypothetical protein